MDELTSMPGSMADIQTAIDVLASPRMAVSPVNFHDGVPCWDWCGSLTEDGYGAVMVHGVADYAHRVAYQLFIGPVGDRPVRHHCRNRRCINPLHLALGEDTPPPGRLRGKRCKHGHDMSFKENVIRRQDGAGFRCRQCHRAVARASGKRYRDRMRSYKQARQEQHQRGS